MKRIKKIVSVVLAVIMMMAMTLTAFATEGDNGNPDTQNLSTGYSITINGKTTGHKYQAYQVFTGDLKDGKLSNIRWAEGVDIESEVDGKTLIAALNENEIFKTVTNAAQVADALAANNTAETAAAFADIISKYLGTPVGGTDAPQYFGEGTKNVEGKIPYTMQVESAGYYFVKDAEEPDAEGASYTDYILQVVGPTTVESKDTTVEIDKDILDPDPTKTNMAGIGDDVTYQLTSKVPDYKAYDYYYFIMQDQLSNGLTFNNDVVIQVGTVTTDDATGKKTFKSEKTLEPTTDYTVYVGSDDTILAPGATTEEKTFIIAFNDIKTTLDNTMVGKDIVVTYSAKINENAEIGSTGNKNEVHLIYSNNPNESGKGTNEENKPGLPDKTKNPPIGETPKSIVITFVADLTIYKTDGTTKQPLAGAEFTLTGISTQTVLTGKEVYTPSADGTYYQLKEGGYTEDAPTEEASMQPLPAGATAGYVVAEGNSNDTGKIVVGGITYRPYKEGDTSTVYILVEPNSDKYASVTTKFTKSTASETTLTSKYIKAIGTSDKDGKVIFKTLDGELLGLGDGTYTITETKTPEGYNTLSPVTVVIDGTVVKADGETAITANDKITGTELCKWSFKGSSIDFTITNKEEIGKDFTKPGSVQTGGIYWVNIENKSGSLLPSTGGIGTTIFYVVGGILVIGAGILLVAKKRMSSKN